ncbi:LuxR C-terminal-related transcriptional regulator [Paenibacillus sp. SC116]|uniref:LuxR C-terminal-related transcriptional regulator n=1 Tax=Paenibacillus sp. SC116 TaxID=2968986 RepID=UPI00215A9A80|nr:LuxR C-terminal-related transcriptional regulator [Paenibacillus sp. SC116]MCR8842432.1 LuxR C-terminal-related transcriptional regulator [Paenibacillus sp. SC116]
MNFHKSAALQLNYAGLMLTSKISIPAQSAHDVIRTRLMTRLDDSIINRLTIVTAPAGFGKTTLVSRWIHIRNRRAAWISLDETSNELISFWSDVSYAIDSRFPGFAGTMLPILQSCKGYSGEMVASFLLQELIRLDERCLLVLDDYHMISNSTVHNSLSFVIEHLPETLRIILLSRMTPPLPLSRLRSRKQMGEINGADLRFTLEEVHELQLKSSQSLLSDNDLALIQQKTEGWAAGLILAFLYVEGKGNISATVKTFSGNNHYIFDYFMEEVLSRQSDDIQLFLLQTAVLDSICIPLVNAVTERSDAAQLLSTLERNHMFLNRIDDTRTWYRYHHLFITMLRERLVYKLSSLDLKNLHRRAYEWLNSNGLCMQAISHALQAGAHEAAAECMDRNLAVIISSGEESTLLDWLEQIPLSLIATHPDLFYFQVGKMAFMGRLEEASRLLEQVMQHINRDAGSIITASAMNPGDERLRLGLFQASIAYYQGDVDKFIALIDVNMEGLKKFASIVKVVNLHEALLYRGPIGFGGRLSKMHELSMKVSESEQRRQAVHYALQGHGYVFLADLYYEWNRLDEAVSALDQIATVRLSPQTLGIMVPCVILQSKIHQARGEWDEAKNVIEQMIRYFDNQPYKHWLIMLEARLVRICYAQGDLEAGERWMKSRHFQSLDAANVHVAREYEQLTVIRILIKRQQTDRAIRMLKQLEKESRAMNRLGSRIEILLLLALAYHGAGKELSSKKSMEEACSLAEPEGYTRIFLDEGGEIAERLAACGAAYAQQLLSLLSGNMLVQEHTSSATSTAIVSLTPREQEMLQFIANGYSNDEIARSLYLSEGTVKRYIHHLYQKLDVKNRVQAVSQAKKLHLL